MPASVTSSGDYGPKKKRGRPLGSKNRPKVAPAGDGTADTDPLSFYNENPIEDFAEEVRDPTTGQVRKQVFRLGPGPTALRCWECLKPWRLLAGSNRSGKSTHTLVEVAAYARGMHPFRPSKGPRWPDARPVNILVLITTRMQAKEVWAERLLNVCRIKGPAARYPLIPAGEVADVFKEYAGSIRIPRIIELTNGSRIFFYWSGHEKAWEKIEGMAFDAIVRDESTGNENLIKEIRMRLLEAQSDASLPHAGWFLWCASNTKDNPEFDEYVARCKNNEPGHAAFQIQPDENPAVTMESRQAMAATMDADDVAVRVWGTGDYADRLRIFSSRFDKDRVLLPAEPIAPDDNIWVAYDPAFGRLGSKSAMLYALVRRDAPMRLHVDQVTIKKGWTLADAVRDIQRYASGRKIECIVTDPAILKTEAKGESVYTQFEAEIRTSGLVIHRGVVTGRNRKDDTYPLMLSYLERSLYRLNLADPGCVELASQFQSARRKDATRYSGDKGVVDKKLDALAALRYLTSLQPSWTNRGLNLIVAEQPVTEQPFERLKRLLAEGAPPPSDMAPEEQRHLEWLRAGAASVTQRMPHRPSWQLRTVRYR